MSSSRKITLKSKLSALIIFFIATLLLIGTLAMQQLWNISRQQRAMFTDTVVPVRIVVDAARQGATHFRRMYVYIWKEDRQARDEELRLNAESEKAVLAAMQMLQTESSDAGLKALGAKLQDTWASYKQALLKVQEMADRADPGAMQELHESPAKLHVAVRTILLDASKRQEDLARQDTENAARDVERTFWLLTSLILACALISSVLGVWLVRSIMRQLGGEPAYAAEIAQEVAKGNLAIQVQLAAADRSSVLANMEAMRAHLAQLVRQVRQSSESIATGSNQIASGNSDLSQRTEEQASNLAQTAASMEQMNATVRQNLDAVHTASSLAVSARDTAARGGTVMGDVVSTMQAITASSRKVEDIVGVIDSIAFQTNILALNAAVEAARAGEQGRGFAVVASEVRALAQRSAEAAKEIKQLIGASVGEVGAGSRLVSEAGVTMQDLVDQVRQVAVLIADIGSAAQEQVQGISQVSDAVNQLDQVTQQNAALVEESAAAANSLSTQAAKLVELVGVFRLSGEPASLADPAYPPAHALPQRVAGIASAAQKPAAVAQADRRRAPAVRQLPPAGEASDWEKF